MKIMPVSSNYASPKNNNCSKASDNMAFGMRVQVDTESIIKTLDSKIKDTVVRVGVFENIMDVVTAINASSEKLFKAVMDMHYAPKDLQPKDLDGFSTAVATLKLAESPEKPIGLWTDVTLESVKAQAKCIATSGNLEAPERIITEVFSKFVSKFLEQSEVFQRRMATVRAAAESKWEKLKRVEVKK